MYTLLSICTFNIIIIIITMWISATNIIYSPINNKYLGTNFLEPIEIKWVDTDYLVLDLITKLYKNCTFNIIYWRISMPGRFFKYCSLKTIWVVVVWSLFNIFKIVILLTKFIMIRGRGGWYDFFYTYYNNKHDIRKILFLDKEWRCNPDNLQAIVNLLFMKNSQIIQPNKWYYDVLYSSKSLFYDYNPNTDVVPVKLAINEFKGKLHKHPAVWDPTGKSETGYGYLTSLSNSIVENWYNKKKPIISLFTGIKKDTTFLPLDNYKELMPLKSKISISELSIDYFKNYVLIEELGIVKLPIEDINSFDPRIRDEVAFMKSNWTIIRQQTKHLGVSDIELLHAFTNSIGI